MKVQLTTVKEIGLFSLCIRTVVTMCVCAVFLMAQSDSLTMKDTKSREAVDAAHKALGGADKISGIKSLIIKGTGTNAAFSRTDDGPFTRTGSSVKYDFEIRILLPDSFLRIERLPVITTHNGISNGILITTPMMTPGSPGGGNTQPDPKIAGTAANAQAQASANEAQAKTQSPAVINQIDEWSRFLIGTLAKAGPAPLTLSSSTSGGFILTKPDGDVGEIEFDAKTGYPSVVKYKWTDSLDSIRSIIGGTPGAQDTAGNEIRFRDRFSVGGIMFPRIINTVGPTMDREITIEEVQINPDLSQKDFEFSKNN